MSSLKDVDKQLSHKSGSTQFLFTNCYLEHSAVHEWRVALAHCAVSMSNCLSLPGSDSSDCSLVEIFVLSEVMMLL